MLETITKVLAALYELPEKPLDSNEFIRDFLSVSAPDDVETLRQDFTALQTRLNQIDADIEAVSLDNKAARSRLDRLQRREGKAHRPKRSPRAKAQRAAEKEAMAAANAINDDGNDGNDDEKSTHGQDGAVVDDGQ